MLPMGTIVTCCMIAGLLVALKLPVLDGLPNSLKQAVGWIVLSGGLWNTFWYGVQHLTEFWGYSALVSGILMMITALFILIPEKLPALIRRSKPMILVLLAGYATLYGVTIARL